MPAIARKDGIDIVDTVHVSVGDAVPNDGVVCDASLQIIATDEGSDNVYAVGYGVVRKNDKEKSHTIPPACATHQTGLASYSPTVFANGKEIGRKNDTYTCGAKIITVNQSTVYANGD